jgi:nitrate/nitrite transporter NarK
MFNVKIVGTANAIAAGWGNMGGGACHFVSARPLATLPARAACARRCGTPPARVCNLHVPDVTY